MKVIHIESGLGNQMLSYCEYLALKKANPTETFYIETIIFDIPECNETICQWNGYELNKIFGIDSPPNIRSLFNDEEWNNIIKEIRNSKFWEKNWNYPIYFTKAFNNAGLKLINFKGDYEQLKTNTNIKSHIKPLLKKIRQSYWGYYFKRMYDTTFENKKITQKSKIGKLFISTEAPLFTGQWLALKFRGNNREIIDNEIRKTFIFPDFQDAQNKKMSDFLQKTNSVAIHARRGDMLGENFWCYKYGYFKRAINYIRKHVENPIFVFFTNPGSIQWCKENEDIFGLNYDKDKVLFVDWNSGENSYRDMQLMSYCKHAIITNSTFGWWGAYFISNPNKITISPLIEIDTTVHC